MIAKDKLKYFELIEKLRLLKTREEGMKILNNENFNRSQLVEICKILDIQTNKNIALLKNAIIETTIGYRIRSNSIQNFN